MEHRSETLPASTESVPAAQRTPALAASSLGGVCSAVCSNVADCPRAAAGAAVEWYPGAGEYCPECGEALTERDGTALPPRPPSPASAGTRPTPLPSDVPVAAILGHPAAPGDRNAPLGPRLLWILAAALTAAAAVAYAAWDGAFNRATTDVIRVCPIAAAQQLAADLVRGYAANTETTASRFDLTQAAVCEVRFVLAPGSPHNVIARDGIVAIVNPLNPISRLSKMQLRAIFSGSIRDWSQLGAPRGPIVPILPDAGSDEANVLASSLFSGVRIDRGVLRGGTSADVTRIVTRADRTGRRAIGLVAFRQLAAAKVVPLADIPAPDATSIAAGRYPYTLTIGIEPGAGRSTLASGLIDYAKSSDGAAIVRRNGLIPPAGP
jgi:hypothetical protein